MNFLENLELEFQPTFDVRVRQIIDEQIPIYAVKYPFVGKITVGMGAVAVSDKDGVSMHSINWKDLDKRNPNDDDVIFDQIQTERQLADSDEFIVFLTQVQYSKLCSFCPDDITFC